MADAVTAPAPSPSHRAFASIAWIAAVAACAVALAWVVDPGGLVRHAMVLDQFTSLELGFALCAVLMGAAASTKSTATRLVSAVFAIAGLVLGGWLFVFFSADAFVVLRPTLLLVSVSITALVLCLYAGWLTAGSETVYLIGGALVFGYVAQYLPAWIGSPPIRLDTYIFYMVFGSNGVLGQALQIISTSVVVFIIFGGAFELAGGSRAIGAVALLIARIGRGAAISVSIVASGLFGMISGSATSNVLAAGSFSIPGMKRMGLSPATAGGIEAVASTIGQVMPPVMGAAAFLMANITGIPYSQVALASLAPALLCYLALFLQGEAIGKRIEARDGRVSVDAEHVKLDWGDLLHLVPVIGLVVSLVVAQSRPELAGAVAAGLALIVAFIRKGPATVWRELGPQLQKSASGSANLLVTASSVGILLAVISSTGLDVQLTLLISTVGHQSLILSLLLASVVAFILGLGVGTSGVYIVTGTLLAPGLVHLGVPLMAAHLFVLYSAMLSMITPPVAFASLSAAGLAGAGFYETSNEAMKFGWALFLIPFLIVYSPGLVLVGSPWTITVTMISAGSAVLLMSHAATEGWRSRSPAVWAGFMVGVALLLPIIPEAPRLVLAILGLIWTGVRFYRGRKRAAAAA